MIDHETEVWVPAEYWGHERAYRLGHACGFNDMHAKPPMDSRAFCAYMQGVQDGVDYRKFLLDIGVPVEDVHPRMQSALTRQIAKRRPFWRRVWPVLVAVVFAVVVWCLMRR